MKIESFEYLAELLPDGHLSIPDKIKNKLKGISKKKIKINIKLEAEKTWEKRHPAFGIWADRLSEGDSKSMAEALRKKIEIRTDAI